MLFLLKYFHADILPRLHSGLFEQRFFNTRQMSLRGAYQIINPSFTHLFQGILRWNTAIHEPGAPEFPIPLFDTIQKLLQCCRVSCIPGIYFIGRRKSFRRQHQRYSTTCTQSERLSQPYSNRFLPPDSVDGGSLLKYIVSERKLLNRSFRAEQEIFCALKL